MVRAMISMQVKIKTIQTPMSKNEPATRSEKKTIEA
jgi:hypothetical protein